MKILVFTLLSFCFLFSCSSKTEQKDASKEAKPINRISDTIIGKKNITDEIAGSAYRKRATGYFVIVKDDTSGFMPIFIESNEDGRIWIDLNLPYARNTETYAQRLVELDLILPTALKEYNLDSLSGVSIGRLVLTGDLAIEITEQYKNKFGENEKITTADYGKICNFLLETNLAKDLNKLFGPYSISVENISVEKVFFTSKKELLKCSNPARDTGDIPDKIFDCITWINFKNK